MFSLFALLVIAVIGELAISHRPLWRWRKPLSLVVAGMLTAATVGLLAMSPGLGTLAVTVVTIYSLFNLARIGASYSEEAYMRHSSGRTSDWLGLAHAVLGYFVLVSWHWSITAVVLLTLLAVVQLVVSLVVLASTRRQMKTTRLPGDTPELSDSKLPTVTVAVPVRNEGHQLEACLAAVLASNYPKMEVLAFDDDSSDHTPEIIRSFAHSGVRFIRSAKSSKGWLDKNRAYERLAAEASGQYILFVGADIRLAPRSLRQLVALAEYRGKDMVTVLPQNKLVKHLPLLQAMRYYWEMAPPRRLFRRPPVLSSCWLIKRETLGKAGGFAAARRSITPEAYLARHTASHDDGYSFIRSDHWLEITSEKPVSEQRRTALFRRYPQAHRRPEVVLALSSAQAVLLVAPPLVALVSPLFGAAWQVSVVAALATLTHCWAFMLIQQAVFTRVASWRSFAALPACIVADIYYLNASMTRYEFGQVAWKDRNVSRPVMQIKPQ